MSCCQQFSTEIHETMESTRNSADKHSIENSSLIKRELSRSHRAQPVLVESLLLVSEAEKNSKSGLSMHLILGICQFAQKMKWLTPWGAEYVDEACRAPICDIPRYFRGKLRDYDLGKYDVNALLDRKAFNEMAADVSQQWDRIYAFAVDDMGFVENLPEHPCEELHVDDPYKFNLDEAEKLARCRNLKALSVDCRGILEGHIRDLQNTSNITKLFPANRLGDTFSQQTKSIGLSALHRAFPHLESLRIDSSYRREPNELNAYINDRQKSLRHIHISIIITREIAEALAMCANIVSLTIDFPQELEDIMPLLSSPKLQKTLRYIDIGAVRKIEDFDFLKNYTALRWAILNKSKITNESLRAMLLQNRSHIIQVSLQDCPNVTSEVLETFAQCIPMDEIHLGGSGVGYRAVKAYQSMRWRNANALKVFQKDIQKYMRETGETLG